jgi:hypothetical protein
MLVSMECKKSKKKFASLPRAMTKALGKDFLKKKFCKISLPSAMVGGPQQRFLGKKIKISLPRARGEALGKKIQKKEQFFAEGPRRRPSTKMSSMAPVS